jgi:hypothetical protein
LAAAAAPTTQGAKWEISFNRFQPSTRTTSERETRQGFLEGESEMSELRKRIAEINTGQPICFDPTEGGEKFWHEGVGAFYKDLLIERCPYPAGLARDNWLRGWMAAEFIGFCQFEWPESM